VRVLFVEGQDPNSLKELARKFPHPYRLLYRKEQELYLLEAWAYTPEMEAEASKLEGMKSWSFEMIEEGVQRYA